MILGPKQRAALTWRMWFAWHPVRLCDGRWCWLETVMRKPGRREQINGDGMLEEVRTWKYRRARRSDRR